MDGACLIQLLSDAKMSFQSPYMRTTVQASFFAWSYWLASEVNERNIKSEAGAQSSKLPLTPWKARPACLRIHLIARAES